MVVEGFSVGRWRLAGLQLAVSGWQLTVGVMATGRIKLGAGAPRFMHGIRLRQAYGRQALWDSWDLWDLWATANGKPVTANGKPLTANSSRPSANGVHLLCRE